MNEEYRKKELRREKIKDYAIKQTEKGGCREGAEITAIYDFTDEFNNYKYSKEDQDYTVKQSKENKTVQE